MILLLIAVALFASAVLLLVREQATNPEDTIVGTNEASKPPEQVSETPDQYESNSSGKVATFTPTLVKAHERRWSILDDKRATLEALYSDSFEHTVEDILADSTLLNRLRLGADRVFYTTIAGTSHRNSDRTSRVAGIRKCEEDDVLDLVLEPDNAYDPNAIAVFFDERQLGYFNTRLAGELTKDIAKNGTRYRASFRRPTIHPESGKIVGGLIVIVRSRSVAALMASERS